MGVNCQSAHATCSHPILLLQRESAGIDGQRPSWLGPGPAGSQRPADKRARAPWRTFLLLGNAKLPGRQSPCPCLGSCRRAYPSLWAEVEEGGEGGTLTSPFSPDFGVEICACGLSVPTQPVPATPVSVACWKPRLRRWVRKGPVVLLTV